MSNHSANSAKGYGIPLLLGTACLAGTVCWLLAAGTNFPGKPKPADAPVSPEKVLDFNALYSTHCAACHGANGKLGPAPPLNDSLFRAIVPQDVVEEVITAGRPGTPMPGFDREHGGRLTGAQIQVLANQIKGVAYKIVDSTSNGSTTAKIVEDPDGIAPVWGIAEAVPSNAPPYLAAERDRAAESKSNESNRAALFAKACAECHGEHGEGTEIAGAINNANFLALASDPMLRRIIITGRPDLGMPDYESTDERPSDFAPLKSADVEQLVSLLQQWRQRDSSNSK